MARKMPPRLKKWVWLICRLFTLSMVLYHLLQPLGVVSTATVTAEMEAEFQKWGSHIDGSHVAWASVILDELGAAFRQLAEFLASNTGLVLVILWIGIEIKAYWRELPRLVRITLRSRRPIPGKSRPDRLELVKEQPVEWPLPRRSQPLPSLEPAQPLAVNDDYGDSAVDAGC